MKKPPHTIPIIAALFLFVGVLSSQVNGQAIRIDNPSGDTLFYCGNPVAVAPGIIIENFEIVQPSDGIKISIANYVQGEDILRYDGTDFLATWNDAIGNLELTGEGTAAELQEAVRQVYYENTSGTPETEFRSISISLLDADFLPESGHFYQYIQKVDVSWSEARDSAANLTYYGLQGYLATITDSVENDFIWSKIDGIGWIGATDQDVEGEWKWASGPEAGTVFWQGAVSGEPVNGNYSNWAAGEPNDNYGEDYAHISLNPNNEPKTWNDLRIGGDGIPGSYYRSQGFIVEYGGMPGDPEIQLSASAVVGVNQVPEVIIVEYDTLVCGERQQSLTIQVDQQISTILRPIDSNATVLDNTTLNPTVQAEESGRYRFELETFNENQCSWYDTITIFFQHQPVADLNIDENSCVDYNLQLAFEGEAEEGAFFEWYSNDTVFTSGTDLESVVIPLGEGISNRTVGVKVTETGCSDSIQIPVAVKPNLEIQADRVQGCSPLDVRFSYTASEQIDEFNWQFGEEGTSTDENPEFTFEVTDTGGERFDVALNVISAEGCESSDTVENMIQVKPGPNAALNIDENSCVDYNLQLAFEGEAEEGAFFEWYSNDTVFTSGIDLESVVIPLGEGISNRTVGLKVTETGCSDSIQIPVAVKPALEIQADQVQGCSPLNVRFSYTASEQINEFNWQFGEEGSSTAENPEFTFEVADTGDESFNVALNVISAEGCESSDTVENMIQVQQKPTVDLNFDESVCYDGMEEIRYIGNAGSDDTFIWDLSDLRPENIIEDPGNSPGPLLFDLTDRTTADIGLQVVSEFGCKTDTLIKTYKRNPILSIAPDTLGGCPPFEVNLSVSAAGFADQVEYTWDLGNGQTAQGSSISPVYSQENQFFDVSVYGVSEETGCADSLFLPGKIFVYPDPEASFTVSNTTVLASDSEIRFENTSSGASLYEWNFGDDSFGSTAESPVYRYETLGMFEVSLLAENDFGCIDSASTQIAVAFDKVFPPTAFSPNAALEEDREFRIYAEGIVNEGYKMLIYNRWGEVIFTSGTPEKGWDGKMENGSNAPAGTYFWVLEYFDVLGKEHSQKGSVTLLY